jgi:hypothetical protein
MPGFYPFVIIPIDFLKLGFDRRDLIVEDIGSRREYQGGVARRDTVGKSRTDPCSGTTAIPPVGPAGFHIDAHFHVFTAAEANEFRNILHLGLISLFDVVGASTTTDFRFYASHDEYIDVAWYEGADWQLTMKWFFSDGT